MLVQDNICLTRFRYSYVSLYITRMLRSIFGSSHEYECGQNKLNEVLISQIDERFGKFKSYFLVMYMMMESHGQ